MIKGHRVERRKAARNEGAATTNFEIALETDNVLQEKRDGDGRWEQFEENCRKTHRKCLFCGP